MPNENHFYGAGRHKDGPDAQLARLAAKQDGVASLEQLLAIGFTYDQVRRRVERGILHRVHVGVFAVGHPRLTPRGHLRAALLACGGDAFLSHRTAAAVWGLRETDTRRINVTLTRRTNGRKGLIVHRITEPHPEDVRVHNALRVSSIPRMLIEVAATEHPAELDRVITQLARKRRLNMDAIERAFERHKGCPGVARLKHALRHYRDRPDRKSELEKAFDRLIARTDIPPPQTNVTIDGWELDCYWPGSGLAVELDGRPYHIAIRDIEKDKFKDGKLLRLGVHVLRITDMRMELDSGGVLDDVRALTVTSQSGC